MMSESSEDEVSAAAIEESGRRAVPGVQHRWWPPLRRPGRLPDVWVVPIDGATTRLQHPLVQL